MEKETKEEEKGKKVFIGNDIITDGQNNQITNENNHICLEIVGLVELPFIMTLR
jgi:hypothetical protein